MGATQDLIRLNITWKNTQKDSLEHNKSNKLSHLQLRQSVSMFICMSGIEEWKLQVKEEVEKMQSDRTGSVPAVVRFRRSGVNVKVIDVALVFYLGFQR